MENLLETYGFDLLKVAADARANGNEDFAVEVEKNIANMQTCFDVIAERHASCPDEPVWKIDADYLRNKLK